MTRNSPVLMRAGFVAIIAAGLVLSACGRRGPPEPPPITTAPIEAPASTEAAP